MSKRRTPADDPRTLPEALNGVQLSIVEHHKRESNALLPNMFVTSRTLIVRDQDVIRRSVTQLGCPNPWPQNDMVEVEEHPERKTKD